MNKDLYEVLQEVNRQKQGPFSILSPKSESDEDRNAFVNLISALGKLRELGFVKFRDQEKYYGTEYLYQEVACELTYDGNQALSYGSYEAYQKNLPADSAFGIKIDQSFNNYGAIHHSNIATHSQHVQQTLNNGSDVEKLFQQIIETLQQDKALAETQRQELIEDVQSLKKELQRTKPRSGTITELYSALGNTASIASYLPQLQALIQPLLP